jgi:hypothetical protein
MSKLSLEVMFTILENTELDVLLGLSLVDRQFAHVCKSKDLWKRIFNRHGLVMLKKSKSVSTWTLNFKHSLLCKITADNLIEDPYYIIQDIDLASVNHASVIHIPGFTNKDKLEGLIIKNRLTTKIHPCTFCEFIGDALVEINGKRKSQGEGLYKLYIEKWMNSFSMSIKEFCTLHGRESKEHFYLKLNKEQVSLLLYKLCYYSLLKTLPAPGHVKLSIPVAIGK